MYKYFVIFAVAFVFVNCATVPLTKVAKALTTGTTISKEPVAIVSQQSDANPEGSYNWSFESADGTKAEEVAVVKTLDKDNVVEDVHGSYTYVDPEGKTHAVQYVANEYGFFPKGDDVFPEIADHLAYLEANPQPIEVEDKLVH